MARLNLTRSRIFGIGLATAALAFAACGHSNSTPTVTATATATSIVAVSTTSSPCILSLGIAYEPDGGNGNGFNGIQVTHYEGNDDNTCGAVGPTALPSSVAFSSSVGEFVIGDEGSDGIQDALAVLKNASGGYSLVQDVFGATAGILTPAGTAYDASLQPPTAAPVGGATPGPVTTDPIIPDITSLTIAGGGSAGVGLLVGPGASPPAIVAVTSLENAPPSFGSSVGFNDSTYTNTGAPNVPRYIIGLAPTTTSAGTVALVRSESDLLSFAVTDISVTGYQFNAQHDDPNLGTGTGVVLRGAGDIAFDPADGARALIGSTTAGNRSELTLITGLPGTITESAQVTMPGVINSIAIADDGNHAVIGTTAGLVVISGVSGTSLSIVTPFSISPLSSSASAISYTNCNGVVSKLTDVYSVRLGSLAGGSAVNQFLVALGTAPGVTCPSGNDASIVAIPFDPDTGSTPAPTATPTASPKPSAAPAGATPTPTASPSPPAVFVQNNIIAPPTGADLLVVK